MTARRDLAPERLMGCELERICSSYILGTLTPDIDDQVERFTSTVTVVVRTFNPMSLPNSRPVQQIIWKQFCSKISKKFTETSVMFQNLHVHTNLEIPEKGVLNLSTFIQEVSGCFEIVLDETTLVLSGRILLPENKEEELITTVTVSSENAFNLTSNDVYNEMESRGYQYNDHFRGILNAQVAEQVRTKLTKLAQLKNYQLTSVKASERKRFNKNSN
uniref:Uncharacterized protein n=1 Tax=Timema bartmani TaxID=61472 RepID=A0A7R9F119_9NEOP|nr:unnamed protein product [Timema bartmani]